MSNSTSTKSVVIIDGHPDPAPERYVHALTQAYADGARAAGHAVEIIEVARLDFPLLRTAIDFEKGTAPEKIRRAQESVRAADHLLIIYPLWLGSMPALLKAFFEQLFRPTFVLANGKRGAPRKLLAEKSAHVVVTMGMPGLFYRWFYRAHSLKSLERNVLSFVGFRLRRSTLIGMVAAKDVARRKRWLEKVRKFGARAS